jgi:GNAT superfamily N-acetyltransferase
MSVRHRELIPFFVSWGIVSNMHVVRANENGDARTDQLDTQYFLTLGDYGFRLYDHDRDEHDVCRLCWSNALPGGRPFPLIPEAGALSFGRVVTGPFARCARKYFYVADDLNSGRLIGYLTGAEGSPIDTEDGKVPWMIWRDEIAEQIAEDEFGEVSLRLYVPAFAYLEGGKLLYTLSLGRRAVQFLLHAKFNNAMEMPKAPSCPEFHFHVAKGHRGLGIGSKLIEHFVSQFSENKYKKICAQVTVCEGQKPLQYYQRMSHQGKEVWKVYDKRETNMYTAAEKQEWDLGEVVENVTLVADKKRLLDFVRQNP